MFTPEIIELASWSAAGISPILAARGFALFMIHRHGPAMAEFVKQMGQ